MSPLFGSRSKSIALAFLSLLIAAPTVLSDPSPGCISQSCDMKYRGVWTAITVQLSQCTPTEAQGLIPHIQYELDAAPFHWSATPDGSNGTWITFDLPLQTQPQSMFDALFDFHHEEDESDVPCILHE